jgi:hypothetical protein
VTLRCHASAEETPISYIRVEWVYEKTPMKSRVRAPINWRLFDCYIARRSLEQTTANQERELRQVAGRMGCEIVKVYKDYGISGAKGRDKPSSRPPLQKKRGREPLRPHATKGAIITGE